MIPTLTYQWPLTYDIYFHISVAQVYSHYGFTLINPLYNPPVGTPIGYPPFFSMFLLFLHSLLKINYIQVARLVQPLFAMLVVLSVSYVAKKFYGDIAGISAGFLILSSYLFGRIITPLPETLALILVPLVVYLYYRSVMDKKYKYAIISSLLFLVVILTHQATMLLLFLVITFITLILGILKRETRFFTSYAMFLFLSILIGVLVFGAVLLIAPSFLDKIYTYGLTVVTGYMVSLGTSEPISYLKYVAYLLIPLIFAIIGGILALKRRENKDLLIIIWILVIFLMSKSYLFGINVYSIRLLVHLLLPLSILGGMGLSYLYLDFKKREFPSKSIRSIFLITIFVISSLFAIVTVTDPQFPQIPKYASGNGLVANPQIAPPTNSDLDMAKWFNENGNKNKSVLITNVYSGWILMSLTGQPIAKMNGSSPRVLDGRKTTPQLTTQIKNTDIGYLVYDKRLNFQSQNPSLDVARYHDFIMYSTDSHGIIPSSLVFVRWSCFIYYSTDIHGIIPTYAHIVHENDNYIICEITQDNQF